MRLLDQAGWHTTEKLAAPANITRLLLPARAPELNPVEDLWQFMRDDWLGRNTPIDRPWRSMSIGWRPWTRGF